jgi:arylsulfatase A-like enzyme
MKILILDLDTLRPDHLGCYGYHRNTSPNIDEIASEGIRFEKYYASDAPCLPSRAALVSGMFGIHNGAVGHGGTCADMRIEGASRSFHSEFADNSLWSVFRRAGMYTCTISPFAERHSAYWFLAGFNEMHNPFGKCGNETADEMTPAVLKWLENNLDRENWVLHVNYWDPHTPYRAPEDFGNPFENDPIPDWLTPDILQEHLKLAGPHTARDNAMYSGSPNPHYPRQINDIKDYDSLVRCIDGYDCGIKYLDEHIGKITAFLKEKGIWEETAIIVTADHGENFGELGIYSEHGTADHITCRIPMIIKWPGMKKGHTDTGLHYNTDLAPTVAELLNTPAWDKWDGTSYASALSDASDCGRNELVLSQMAHVCQRSVRWDKWLYMKTYHDGYHPHFKDEMLFDIENDPHETTDLSEKFPEILSEGADRLQNWHEKMMKSMPFSYTKDPMETVLAEGGPFHANAWRVPVEQYKQRLKETGRGDKIPLIAARHPEFR